jgi:hypothetical protein
MKTITTFEQREQQMIENIDKALNALPLYPTSLDILKALKHRQEKLAVDAANCGDPKSSIFWNKRSKLTADFIKEYINA